MRSLVVGGRCSGLLVMQLLVDAVVDRPWWWFVRWVEERVVDRSFKQLTID
jgi:hypothetical protein